MKKQNKLRNKATLVITPDRKTFYDIGKVRLPKKVVSKAISEFHYDQH